MVLLLPSPSPVFHLLPKKHTIRRRRRRRRRKGGVRRGVGGKGGGGDATASTAPSSPSIPVVVAVPLPSASVPANAFAMLDRMPAMTGQWCMAAARFITTINHAPGCVAAAASNFGIVRCKGLSAVVVMVGGARRKSDRTNTAADRVVGVKVGVSALGAPLSATSLKIQLNSNLCWMQGSCMQVDECMVWVRYGIL
jgi:hypothetical protein